MNYIIGFIMKFLSIDEGKRNKIKKIWYPLFLIQGLILVSVVLLCWIFPVFWPIEMKVEDIEFRKQEWFVTCLILASNFLVCYNTNMFISDADSVIIDFLSTESNSKQKERLINLNSRFKKLNQLTFAFSLILVAFFILHFCQIKELNLEVLFIANEILTILIFISFCFADYFMLEMLKITLSTNPQNKNLNALNAFTKSAFPLIDIAGAMGAILIGILSLIFHFHISSPFNEGFAIGALAFHIIFTQINFAYLKTIEIKDSD